MIKLLFSSLLLGAAVQAADLPVAASHLVTGPESQVELTNTGTQPVNAWSLAITTALGEGRTRQSILTVDAYLSEATRDVAGFPERLDRLNPGQARIIQLDAVPADATARIVAVVLEDGTAAGDPAVIQSIFERRGIERDDLGAVVEVFMAVLDSQHGMPALQEIKRQLAAGSSPGAESTPHRAAREAVDSYLQRATAENAEQIEQLLRGYVKVVERQYELAVRHAQQKN
ncbi:MAG: hypothetical protein ABI868_12460 [Acidobacteriota bacterium]